jgi:hypothetical protein
MKPCVVLSRQMGSEGNAVALATATLLDYRYVLGGMLKRAASRHGVGGTEWRWLDQAWDRLFVTPGERPNVRLEVLQPVLVEMCAGWQGTLFVGRGVEEILRGCVPMLHAHVVAPFEVRVAQIQRQVNIIHSRAEERVHRSDEENLWFYRTFFGIDWNDLARPHVVIDTAAVSVREAATMLAELLKAASLGGVESRSGLG